jgi:hypothetical protein
MKSDRLRLYLLKVLRLHRGKLAIRDIELDLTLVLGTLPFSKPITIILLMEKAFRKETSKSSPTVQWIYKGKYSQFSAIPLNSKTTVFVETIISYNH